MVTRLAQVIAVLIAGAATGCVQGDLDAPRQLPNLEWNYFHCYVEPVLIKRCAFAACHGSDTRPFRIYAPDRLRLDGSATAPLTPAEQEANYDIARAFAGDADTPRLLQLKGLSAAAGGYFHRGQELYGGSDVFESKDDPGYQSIATWAETKAGAEPGCAVELEIGP